MRFFNLGFIKICTVILFASQLFLDSAMSADFDICRNVLIIGRPEHGGVNIEQASQNFPQINNESHVWYLDPESKGESSIPKHFPCIMPSDKPLQFELVCIEQGMLNEVVQGSHILASPKAPLIFTEDDKNKLAELTKERHIIWESYDSRKKELQELEREIIKEAVELRLIEKSYGEYKIPGISKNTCNNTVIVPHLFFHKREEILSKENMEFASIKRLTQEYSELQKDINNKLESFSVIDKITDPLHKLKDKALALDSSLSTEKVDLIETGEMCRHIQSFIQEAWRLVSPNGVMVVFSGNAKIANTDLAGGILEEFLKSSLSDFDCISECTFSGQNYESELYISNPALPATTDAFGWTGGRGPGSYFLIKKLR